MKSRGIFLPSFSSKFECRGGLWAGSDPAAFQKDFIVEVARDAFLMRKFKELSEAEACRPSKAKAEVRVV